MRKSLLIIPLALTSLLITGACTMSFAAGVANMEEFASPQSEQPSQRLMRREEQANREEQKQNDPAEGEVQGSSPPQAEEASPSQRSMRQQVRDAKRKPAPAADNP